METGQKRPSGDELGSDEHAAKCQRSVALNGLASAQNGLASAQNGQASAQAVLDSVRGMVVAWQEQVTTALRDGNDKAEVEKAEAKVEKAEAEVEKAEAEVEKAEAKVKEAKAEVEKAEAKVNEAEAKVKEAKAVEEAEATVKKAEANIAGLRRKRCVKATDLDFSHSQVHVRARGGCPKERLVEVKTCTAKCLEVIREEQEKDTRMTDPRVRPLMLSRCMRGGKTTMLLELFDQLKAKSGNVIFISFNGDSPIKQLKGETKLETMTRAIAVALMLPMEQKERDNLYCPQDVIKEYLKNKHCVLLVDELHVLLQVTEEDSCEGVGTFLREVFLDPAGRHLTFSTHLPSSAGIDQLLGKGKGSSRSAVAAAMPESSDLAALRAMDPACDTLTPCEAAYYSYIPSLIYTVKAQRYDFEKRFTEVKGKPDNTDELQSTFLREFFTGKRLSDDSTLRAFDSLTLCPKDGEVRWVLGYAGLMCNYLGIRAVAEQVEDLKVHAKTVGHGKDWELITQIALALRCVEAKYSDAHPLVGLPLDLRPASVHFETVPATLTHPAAALAWWMGREKVRFPCIAVLTPQFASFEIFDGMVAWQTEAHGPAHAVGHQNKLKKERPEKEPPDGMNGFLLRGEAPAQASSARKFGSWTYPNKEQLISFLGSSLAPNYPADWPADS